ncbi:MAG: hypothetical protein ACFFCO_08280 [Promethearchaeota archaeon]
MFDYGHFCLLIFAQGPWKPKYKEKLAREVQARFLRSLVARTPDEERHLSFAETAKMPLFDPEELGQSQPECTFFSKIYEFLKEKLGNNVGLFLFSHSVPDVIGFKTVITPLFEERRIKKVYYYELGPETFVDDQTRYLPMLKERRDERLPLSAFLQLLDADKFQCNVVYEIHRRLEGYVET